MVTPYYYPTVVGGAERAVENISIELNKRKIPTDIMTFNFDRTTTRSSRKVKVEEIDGIKVIRVPVLNPLPWRMHLDEFTFKINLIRGTSKI